MNADTNKNPGPPAGVAKLGGIINLNAAIIKKFQQPGGAYPASPTFKVYGYCWLRDGSFTADGMSRAGEVESAERFFKWCSDVIVARRRHILDGGVLPARFNYNGSEPDGDWADFQLDGYGTWLWAMKQHASRHNRSLDDYQEAAGLVQHYLVTHWNAPSYDWWEERSGMHAATLASIYAGLKAYDHPAADSVRERINLEAERVDASLLACALFDAVDEETFAPTLKRIESELVGADGGVHRHPGDTYYGGGEWIVLACLLGWYYAELGRYDDAIDKLQWVLKQRGARGWLPEQNTHTLLNQYEYWPWVGRWGYPANPLIWSHGMLLTLASELMHAAV